MILPPPDYKHSDLHFYLMRDLRTVCMWIAGASLLANFMPHDARLRSWPKLRQGYVFLIDVVAIIALNFRVCLPSLQQEFMGFRKRVKRRVHRWTAERDSEEQGGE